jgi:hypothetical protein
VIWWLGLSLASIIVILLLPPLLAITLQVIVIPIPAIRRHFEPNFEANGFTWFSNLLLLLVAGAAFLNGWLESRPALGPVTSGRFLWPLVGIVPAFLSLDEVAQIHESVGTAVTMEGALHPESGLWRWFSQNYHAWIVVYLPGIVVAVTFLLLTFRRLFGEQRRAFALACLALGFWCGSFPLEYFLEDITALCGDQCKMAEAIAEEGFELLGALGLFLAFLLHGRPRIAHLFAVTASHEAAAPPL